MQYVDRSVPNRSVLGYGGIPRVSIGEVGDQHPHLRDLLPAGQGCKGRLHCPSPYIRLRGSQLRSPFEHHSSPTGNRSGHFYTSSCDLNSSLSGQDRGKFRLKSKNPYIFFQILDNHGHSSYTCLHRVMVHGSIVKEVLDTKEEVEGFDINPLKTDDFQNTEL